MNNKSTYEKVNEICEYGGHAVVYNPENDQYMIVSPFAVKNTSWRDSLWWDSVEKAKDFVGSTFGYTEKDYKDHWQIIDVWYPEHKRFQAGDWVYVLPVAKQYLNSTASDSEIKSIIGRTVQIFTIRSGLYKFMCYEGDYIYDFALPQEALAPAGVLETNEPEEMTLEEVCRELKRDIKIKKS